MGVDQNKSSGTPPGAPSRADAFLAEAIARLAAGDARAALEAASSACYSAPGRPEPHYAYGEAWTALGEHARAEEAFAAALERAPHWADAWVNYGVARYRQNAIDDAKMAMRQALLQCAGHKAAAAKIQSRPDPSNAGTEQLVRSRSRASCARAARHRKGTGSRNRARLK